jgi:hypothetical protein
VVERPRGATEYTVVEVRYAAQAASAAPL